MIEKLVENWLDSAKERTYQPVFCQILTGQGLRVLHSTRHAPIEFGKDVIAVASDGTPHAYQLKATPGSRLTLQEFRRHSVQLRELVHQRIVREGVPDRQHRSFLVTNGEIDEEVYRAIDDLNASNVRDGYPDRRLEVLTRGDLLALARDAGYGVWPKGLDEDSTLYEILAANGEGVFPLDKLHAMLSQLLPLDEGVTPQRLTTTELGQRIAGAAVFVGVALRRFSSVRNHVAEIAAWTMFVAYALAACERLQLDVDSVAGPFVSVAEETIRGRLLDLTRDVAETPGMLVGNPLVDWCVFRGRYTLIAALLSTLWLWCESTTWPTEESRCIVDKFLPTDLKRLDLWGEAAIPQFLCVLFALRSRDATIAPELLLGNLARTVIAAANLDDSRTSLPSPYFLLEDVTRHRLSDILVGFDDPVARGTFRSGSYYAEALFLLFVSTGLKQTCKKLWPDLTRVTTCSLVPDEPWTWLLWQIDQGENRLHTLAPTATWQEVKARVLSHEFDRLPQSVLNRKWFLLLFSVFFPHRIPSEGIRRLGQMFFSYY